MRRFRDFHARDTRVLEKVGWWGCLVLLIVTLVVTWRAWHLKDEGYRQGASKSETQVMNAVVPTGQKNP